MGKKATEVMPIDIEVAKSFRHINKSTKNASLREIESRVGISKSRLQRLLGGSAPFFLHELELLSGFFGVDPLKVVRDAIEALREAEELLAREEVQKKQARFERYAPRRPLKVPKREMLDLPYDVAAYTVTAEDFEPDPA